MEILNSSSYNLYTSSCSQTFLTKKKTITHEKKKVPFDKLWKLCPLKDLHQQKKKLFSPQRIVNASVERQHLPTAIRTICITNVQVVLTLPLKSYSICFFWSADYNKELSQSWLTKGHSLTPTLKLKDKKTSIRLVHRSLIALNTFQAAGIHLQ